MADLSDVLDAGWRWAARRAAIGPRSRRSRRFRRFGVGSAICFPVVALYGERHIEIGDRVIIGPYATVSAGVSPEHDLGDRVALRIGDGVLVGKGSGIVAHASITIGDDVFTGHHVYITDANHGYVDPELPVGHQFAPPRPVVIGAGSWLGHGTIVLPGAEIGSHAVIGAGSVVVGRIPDYAIAVGNPARVVRDQRCAGGG